LGVTVWINAFGNPYQLNNVDAYIKTRDLQTNHTIFPKSVKWSGNKNALREIRQGV